ncbi:MAG: hypothetical protein ACI4R8_01615 [Candidatus Caccovivens sp.]
MKKIFKIARYDFKRLILNPITLVVMIIVMAFCLIFGLAYKVPTTSKYSATTLGQTTQEIYINFNENNKSDNKIKSDAMLTEAKEIISIQSSNICMEHDSLKSIVSKFEKISDDVEKYNRSGSCVYTELNTLDTPSGEGQSIIEAKNLLSNFVTEYAQMEEFYSRLLFKIDEFEDLQTIRNYFEEVTARDSSISEILDDIYLHKNYFSQLSKISSTSLIWTITTQEINALTSNYITKAETKTAEIYAEMTRIYNEVNEFDMKRADDMRNLITNYKLTTQSAKFAVVTELEMLLSKHPNNFYGYKSVQAEDTKTSLAKANYFLQDEGLYYTQYQEALNFNVASYKITAFDYSYTMMCIIGFITIMFGIFCAYKLFGRDRKNGKMDLILSQNVTFNQVFVGKFLAIVLSTSFVLAFYAILTLGWGAIMFGFLPNEILAIFNLNTAYTIAPFWFWLIKIIGIELQVLFYSIITIFLMNLSRKFVLMFSVSLTIFAIATICNIFLNNALWYCLLPFIHADITSFIGGATMESGFLRTALYINGNFFISLIYYIVIVALIYNFTKQLFKKN